QAYLQWACSDAAGLCLRTPPAGHTSLARVETTHGQGKAVTVWAPQRVRAVSDRLRRETVCDRHKCLHASGRRAGEPHASPAPPRLECSHALTASANAQEHRGSVALSPWPVLGSPLRLLS